MREPFLIPLENLNLPGTLEGSRLERATADNRHIVLIVGDNTHLTHHLIDHIDQLKLTRSEVVIVLKPPRHRQLPEPPSFDDLLADTLILERKSVQKQSGGRFWVGLNQPPRSPRKRR